MSDRIDLRFMWKDCQGDYDRMQRRIDRVLDDRDAELERLRTELAALKAEIESAPVVYSFKGIRETVWHPHHVGGDSHRARLIRIEELK